MADLEPIQALITDGRKDEAARQLARVLSTNPGDIQAWLLMATAIDDPARKADCYRQALKLDPQNPVALGFLNGPSQQPTSVPPPAAVEPPAPVKKNRAALPFPSRWQARHLRRKKERWGIT